MDMRLNLELYEDILRIIKDKNVELRHDVDVSLSDAHYMAYIESLYGIKAFYYIRFDCDYYNAYSISNKNRIKQIESYGHTIGVHIEAHKEEDLDVLIDNYGKYWHFTFHINNEFTKSFKKESCHAFENKSIIKGGYVSDSRGIFNEEKFEYIKNNDNFTLVIHPEW